MLNVVVPVVAGLEPLAEGLVEGVAVRQGIKDEQQRFAGGQRDRGVDVDKNILPEFKAEDLLAIGAAGLKTGPEG